LNVFPTLHNARGVTARVWISWDGANGFERDDADVAEPLAILDGRSVCFGAEAIPIEDPRVWKSAYLETIGSVDRLLHRIRG